MGGLAEAGVDPSRWSRYRSAGRGVRPAPAEPGPGPGGLRALSRRPRGDGPVGPRDLGRAAPGSRSPMRETGVPRPRDARVRAPAGSSALAAGAAPGRGAGTRPRGSGCETRSAGRSSTVEATYSAVGIFSARDIQRSGYSALGIFSARELGQNSAAMSKRYRVSSTRAKTTYGKSVLSLFEAEDRSCERSLDHCGGKLHRKGVEMEDPL